MNIVCIYILYTVSLRLETLVSQRCVSKKGLWFRSVCSVLGDGFLDDHPI